MTTAKSYSRSQTDSGIFEGTHDWTIKEFKLRMDVENMIESSIFGVEGKDMNGKEDTIYCQLLIFDLGVKFYSFQLECVTKGVFMIESSIQSQKGPGYSNPKLSLRDKFVSKESCWMFEESDQDLAKALVDGHLHLCCKVKIVAKEILHGSPHGDTPTLADHLAEALLNPECSDVTLVCQEMKFPCHKAILMARSDVFKAMFGHKGTTENETGEVHIVDMEPEDVKQLLHFIYTDKTNLMASNVNNLLAAGDKYNLPKLKLLCGDFMVDKLDVSNAVELLELGQCYRPERLKTAAVNFIVCNMSMVTKTPQWEGITKSCPEGVMEILMRSTKI